MKLLIIILTFVLLSSSASAISGQITLLALMESNGNTSGTTAELQLDIREGTGKVYLDTFPLTKIATQISMRFAQQIACEQLQADCSNKDFFYAIKASPGIIGGPSAGAAATVLTASLLEGKRPSDSFAMTGTINSGGLIGPVGGLREKIKAAADSKLKTVLIPYGSAQFKEDNITTDLIAWGKQNGVEVKEVQSLKDALQYFSNIALPENDGELVIEKNYQQKMESVANDMCNRGKRLITQFTDDLNETKKELAINLTIQGDELISKKSFYSGASYCFRANIASKAALYGDKQISSTLKDASVLLKDLQETEAIAQKPLTTIAELETYFAVQERLSETRESLKKVTELVNDSKTAALQLAYTEERFESAKSWMTFYDLPSKALKINNNSLSLGCQQKIAEAEERFSYVTSFLPESLGDTRNTIDKAYSDLSAGRYADCLYKASRAKAEADIILSAVGFEESQLKKVLQLKLDTVERILKQKQKEGFFPLVGYSYYEYSRSLAEDDLFSALLFAEYSLELSDVGMYFKEPAAKPIISEEIGYLTGIFLIGIIAGILASWFILRKS